jgi:hypothetical protein
MLPYRDRVASSAGDLLAGDSDFQGIIKILRARRRKR